MSVMSDQTYNVIERNYDLSFENIQEFIDGLNAEGYEEFYTELYETRFVF